MTTTPEEEAAAKARRDKVEKMAGQAFDAASGAAKHAAEFAEKAKSYGQEALKNVDTGALKKAGGAGLLVKLLLALVVIGGVGYAASSLLKSGPEKTAQAFYDALQEKGYAGIEPMLYKEERQPDTSGFNMNRFADSMKKGVVEMLYSMIQARGGIGDLDLTCKEYKVKSEPYAKCTAHLIFADGTEDTGELPMRKQNGEWKISL